MKRNQLRRRIAATIVVVPLALGLTGGAGAAPATNCCPHMVCGPAS